MKNTKRLPLISGILAVMLLILFSVPNITYADAAVKASATIEGVAIDEDAQSNAARARSSLSKVAGNVDGKIAVTQMSIWANGERIYHFDEDKGINDVKAAVLSTSNTIKFSLHWEANDQTPNVQNFTPGDTFSIPILTSDGTWKPKEKDFEEIDLYVELEDEEAEEGEEDENKKTVEIHVGTGRFHVEDDTLYYTVLFNQNATMTITGGDAKGESTLEFEEGEEWLEFNGGEKDGKFTVDYELSGNIGGLGIFREVYIVKTDAQQTSHKSGVITESAYNSITTGLAGVSFRVYKENQDKPLTFEKKGPGVYTRSNTAGETLVETDSDGKLKLTFYTGDLGDTFTLVEVDALDGYYGGRKAEFTVNASTDKEVAAYYNVTNTARSAVVNKVDSSSSANRLEGAIFVLYRGEDNSPVETFIKKDNYYWYSKGADTVKLETNSKGQLDMRGLPAGEYYLIEEYAPKGYVKSDESYRFTLAENDEDPQVITITVKNKKDTDGSSSSTPDGSSSSTPDGSSSSTPDGSSSSTPDGSSSSTPDGSSSSTPDGSSSSTPDGSSSSTPGGSSSSTPGGSSSGGGGSSGGGSSSENGGGIGGNVTGNGSSRGNTPNFTTTDIPENDIPLAPAPNTTILDEPIPLGSLPSTGMNRPPIALVFLFMAVSAAALILQGVGKRK